MKYLSKGTEKNITKYWQYLARSVKFFRFSFFFFFFFFLTKKTPPKRNRVPWNQTKKELKFWKSRNFFPRLGGRSIYIPTSWNIFQSLSINEFNPVLPRVYRFDFAHFYFRISIISFGFKIFIKVMNLMWHLSSVCEPYKFEFLLIEWCISCSYTGKTWRYYIHYDGTFGVLVTYI